VENEWEAADFIGKYKIKDIFLIGEDSELIVGNKLVNKEEFISSRCCYIGSYVLAYSRLMI